MAPPGLDTAMSTVGYDLPFLSDAFGRLTGASGDSHASDRDVRLQQAAELLFQAERIIAEQRAHIARLERLSLTDELTGLFNRRGFLREMQREMACVRRHGEASVALLADLDDFKTINDGCGHQAGDEVLVEVGRRLLSAVRETDVVARLGGDEFACLLTKCDPTSLGPRLERIRQAIEGSPIIWNGFEVTIGISLGLARIRGGDVDPAAVLARADEIMYSDKAKRRA